MKRLIRPTLFMLARLGLFFAVVVWVAGQSVDQVYFSANIPLWSVGITAVEMRLTWSLPSLTMPIPNTGTVWMPPEEQAIKVLPTHTMTEDEAAAFERTLQSALSKEEVEEWVFPGIRTTENANSESFAIRHWLTVSTSILFYAVLKFTYRRKPDGSEADP